MTHKLKHGRYFFSDYSMPDPHYAEFHEAMYALYHDQPAATPIQARRVLAAAEAYIHFVGDTGSTESIIKQLREVRRAIRAERKARQ
jgi:hypothetical protein